MIRKAVNLYSNLERIDIFTILSLQDPYISRVVESEALINETGKEKSSERPVKNKELVLPRKPRERSVSRRRE